MNDDRMEEYRRESMGTARMLINCFLGSVIFWMVVIIAFASCKSHGAVRSASVIEGEWNGNTQRVLCQDAHASAKVNRSSDLSRSTNFQVPVLAFATRSDVRECESRRVCEARESTTLTDALRNSRIVGTLAAWNSNSVLVARTQTATLSAPFRTGEQTGNNLQAARLAVGDSQVGSKSTCLHPILLALAQIESGNNPHAVGRHGERTEFQMIPRVLAEANSGLMKPSFTDSSSNLPARRLAAYHLGTIRQSLIIAWNREPTPQEIYCAWNCGISATIKRRIPKSTKRSSERFANLVAFYSK